MDMSIGQLISRYLVFSFTIQLSFCMQCDVSTEQRFDCYPESYPLKQTDCEQRGCCYSPTAENDDVPWCFFPSDYSNGYVLTELREVSYGYEGVLKLSGVHAPYPIKALPSLKLSVFFETGDRIRFKISDEKDMRYQVPLDVPQVSTKTVDPKKYSLHLSSVNETFSLRISRSDTKTVLFDTSIAPVLFGDQFLQISTILASSNIYGLGERHASLRPDVQWNRITFWAADRPPNVPEKENLYGDHPFYMVVEPDGKSHGVFFLNSNAKEAVLQPTPALTWRSIGGIMDFYVFLGPNPDHVVRQYTAVVGTTFMPPLWSLGYHLCRWGYKTANTTLKYVENMRNAKIPQDVQWNDIDYMDKKYDFTYDHANFDTLPNVVNNLHSHGQHYIMIIDPGISDQAPKGSYAPYDDAVEMGILVKDQKTLQPVRGKVWPGEVVFPDFTDPKVYGYWTKQLSRYHDKIPFDGVWIDMNEYSNFMDGSPDNCYQNNTYDYPPYIPRVSGGKLFSRTVCPSSVQYASINYNVHSMTGLFEMNATSYALKAIRNKRPFVISRSTFPSAGKYGGHWTGDVASSWSHLKVSVAGILSFNLFGIPMVGADICGFRGITTEELCIRWTQLGAFYPFSRNHNDIAGSPQAPVDFSEKAQAIFRTALHIRYTFLPYLYTLFYHSHINGSTVARPLFFEFPLDKTTYSIDTQFMWGSGLMISPVLDEGSTSVNVYFPAGVWYDHYLNIGNRIVSGGGALKAPAPIDRMPIHVRGGHIIPFSHAGIVTNVSNTFYVVAAGDGEGKAHGYLYWDDGDSLDTLEKNNYALIKIVMQDNSILIKISAGSKQIASKMQMDLLVIYGTQCQPKQMTANGKAVSFRVGSYNDVVVDLSPLSMSDITFVWTC